MPQHTEEEISRRQRRDALRFPTPVAKEERRPKLPLLARIGRSMGAGVRRNEERLAGEQVKRDELVRTREAGQQQAKLSFSEGLAKFREGSRAGRTGTQIDTSAFDVGAGTTDTTPRPPVVTPENVASNRPDGGGDRGEPGFIERPARSGIVEPNLQDVANQPASVSLNDSSATVIPRPVAKESGQFEGGVPEGFINVIRGTRSSFLRVDEQGNAGDRNTEFRAVPGQTLDQAEQIGARRDPAFNVLTKEGVEQQRVDADTLQAEAQRIEAIFSNSQIGTNSEDQLVLAVPNASGGFDEIKDFTPVVDSLVDAEGNFSISRVPGEGGIFEEAVVLNEDTGKVTRITNDQFLGKAMTEFNNRVQRIGNQNLTINDKLNILEEVEELMGPLPEIEAAILSGQ